MILELKIFFKTLLYLLGNLFLKTSAKTAPKSLVLIRTDAIGDYVLFRNFLESVRKSEKYGDFNITLVGNAQWKALAEELDAFDVDRFVWLDTGRFTKSAPYRRKMREAIYPAGCEIIINTVFSRNFFIDDTVVKMGNAKVKIGQKGDISNSRGWQKRISDRFYTKLVDTEEVPAFEFDRNRCFFEEVLEKRLDVEKPIITLNADSQKWYLPEAYAVVFIGASSVTKKWRIENYSAVATFLQRKYGYHIVLCGGPNDRKDAGAFASGFEGDYTDLVGKTTLNDLLPVIAGARLMVSNETSAVHFAVALQTPNIFVLFNGSRNGRFAPYPEAMTRQYHLITGPSADEAVSGEVKSYGHDIRRDINAITVEQAIASIEKVLE